MIATRHTIATRVAVFTRTYRYRFSFVGGGDLGGTWPGRYRFPLVSCICRSLILHYIARGFIYNTAVGSYCRERFFGPDGSLCLRSLDATARWCSRRSPTCYHQHRLRIVKSRLPTAIRIHQLCVTPRDERTSSSERLSAIRTRRILLKWSPNSCDDVIFSVSIENGILSI